jgi:hypothetical protein
MKKDLKLLKSKQAICTNEPSKKTPPSKLYAICLNRPLIDLWAMTDRYTNDYYDTTVRYRASVYTKSKSSLKSDECISVILSPDDEMMLYNEGLAEYY